MICKESSKRLGLTEGKDYDIKGDGLYKRIINDRGEHIPLTQEIFEIYFEGEM